MYYSIWVEAFANWCSFNKIILTDNILENILTNLKSISSLKTFKEETRIHFKIEDKKLYIIFPEKNFELQIANL